MGFASYFKASTPKEPAANANTSSKGKPAQPAMTEKNTTRRRSILPASTPGPSSAVKAAAKRLSTLSARKAGPGARSISEKSSHSAGQTLVLDEIRHEVMVNYLYQQQCSHLWVGEASGFAEGVLLRKARGHYMACPPELGTSPFAVACAALNVQVRMTSFCIFF